MSQFEVGAMSRCSACGRPAWFHAPSCKTPRKQASPKETDLAAAWDAGFSACADQWSKQRQDPTHPITRNNPFEETA